MKMNNLVEFLIIKGRANTKTIKETLKNFETENKNYKFIFDENKMYVIIHNQIKFKLIPMLLEKENGAEETRIFTDKSTVEILKF